MASLDYAIVALYMVLVAGIGVWAKGLIHGLEDYFVAGRKAPWWVAAISHHISGYSAFVFVGYAAVAYSVGFNIWTLSALPCFLAMSLGAFVWAPRWVRLKVMTPVEYLERRFNNLVRQLVAWSGILIKFMDEGLKLYSLALIVATCTGLPLEWTIAGCGVVAIAYLLLGGLWAEMMTDFVQFLVQFVITILLVPVVLKAVGGWGSMWAQLPPDRFRLFSERFDLPYILVFLVVIVLSYNGGTWGLAQRFYALGKPGDAKKAALLSAALYLVYPLAIYIPVWASPILLGPLAEGQREQAYILVARKFLPTIAPGLLGLLVSAMFAATMSMIDSDINALAAVFTKDIYQRTLNPKAREERLFRVGLVATAVFGAITVAFGLATVQIKGAERAFSAMVKWYAALLGPVTVPLLFGMLYRRTSWRGALGAWIGGFITFVVCKYWLVGLVVRALTGHPPSDELAWTLYTGAELSVTFGIFLLEGRLGRMTEGEERKVEALFAQLKRR